MDVPLSSALVASLAALALAHLACATYLYVRCARRERFGRHLLRSPAILALGNAFVYATARDPDRPFPDVASYPELRALRDEWTTIRDEGLALLAGGQINAATFCNDPGVTDFLDRGWTRFYLRWHGRDLPSARELAPRTTALIRSLPGLRGAVFAMLPPGGRLEPHADPFAGTVHYQLGLATPESDECRLTVDGVERAWRDGEDFVFDKTYLHWVANDTPRGRLVLLCDVERPLRWRWARRLARTLNACVSQASAIQNVESDPRGLPSRAFAALSWVFKRRLA